MSPKPIGYYKDSKKRTRPITPRSGRMKGATRSQRYHPHPELRFYYLGNPMNLSKHELIKALQNREIEDVGHRWTTPTESYLIRLRKKDLIQLLEGSRPASKDQMAFRDHIQHQADLLMGRDTNIWMEHGYRWAEDFDTTYGAPKENWVEYKLSVKKMLQAEGYNPRNPVPDELMDRLVNSNHHALVKAITELNFDKHSKREWKLLAKEQTLEDAQSAARTFRNSGKDTILQKETSQMGMIPLERPYEVWTKESDTETGKEMGTMKE